MANEYLNRTPTSRGNRTTWTLSCWAKISGVTGADLVFFGAYRTGTSQGDDIFFRTGTGGALRFTTYNGTSYEADILDNAYKRDNASWVHVLAVANTTAGTTIDRWHLYVNGVRITDTSNNTYPSADLETNINNLVQHYIGAPTGGDLGQVFDLFFVDGQALTPDVFGFYKEGKGYVSVGSTMATDFRPGQWVPKAPRTIKSEINRKGGFGVNGFYLPMNDSSNFGADFHCDPNSIIKLKGEDLPQPQNGSPTTTDSYVSQLRSDPYASNLVLAIPGITGGQGSGYGDYSADIKGSGSNKTITANGNAGVAVTASYYGSAMQFDGTGDYFSVPNSSDIQFTTEDFTIETWFNTNSLTDNQFIFSQWNVTNDRRSYVLWLDSGVLKFNGSTDGSDSDNGNITNTISVGANQWNHAAFSREGTTTRLFLNGVCIGINTTTDTFYNNTTDAPRIGGEINASPREFDGYIQDLRVYKGVAKYTGGFDVSKPYTPVGIGTWRAVSDTTANNFCNWNPNWDSMNTTANPSYANGNLTVTGTNSDPLQGTGTVGVTTGKWYYETRITANPYNGAILLGIRPAEYFTSNAQNRTSYRSNGSVFNDAGSTVQSGTTYTTNDIIGVAFDMNTKNLWFSKNGSWVYSGDPDAGTDAAVSFASTYTNYTPFFAFDNGAGTEIIDTNFGQNPTFSGNVSATSTQRNADSNGKGEFRYEPPSGFLALCEDNLPTPAIANPGEHFKTVLYKGDSNAGHSITGVGFQPDLVWIKPRNSTAFHHILDSVRGATNVLYSNQTGQEASTNSLISFDSDGFSLGTAGINNSVHNSVAWCWKAGGAAVSNTDGTITSQVSANQTAGFSIVSYGGNSTDNATVGHGLGKTPSFIILKNRDFGNSWRVYHSYFGTNTGQTLYLELTAATATDSNNIGIVNDTTFDVGYVSSNRSLNASGDNYIAYCWTEIENFSKFASYVGNGNADGPFVYCGFKPAWVMIKQTNDVNNWHIADSSRKSINPVNMVLRANLTNTESVNNTNFDIDFLSNGFKLRSTNDELNESNSTYIFAAFAESPFTTANAK